MSAALYAHWLHAQRAAIRAAHHGKERAQARAELSFAIADMRAQLSHAPAPRALHLGAAARRELAFPGRYRLKRPAVAPHRSFLALLWDGLIARWKAFLMLLAKGLRFGDRWRTTFGDVLILIFIGIIAIAIVRGLRALQLRSDRKIATLTPLADAQHASTLYARAEAAAANEEYALALRLLFAATVVLLDLRGVLRNDASATVNELRTALRDQPREVEGPFIVIARQFTQAAYAEHPLRRDDWKAASESYQTLAQRVAHS